jgi:hypothetical protein
MFQQKGKILAIILLLGVSTAALANEAIFTFVNVGAGHPVYGTHSGQTTPTLYWGGVLVVEEEGTDNQIGTFCTDITTLTHTGVQYQINTDPLLDIAMTCELLYILNQYPPGLTDDLSDVEAAARQAAVWYFSNGFVVDSNQSPDVYARAQEIIDEVEGITNYGTDPHLACEAIQTLSAIPNLKIQPVGDAFEVVASFPNGDPVVGLEVFLSTGSPNPVITGDDGKAPFSAPGATYIEAEASYQVEEAVGVTLVSSPTGECPAGNCQQRLLMPGVGNGFVHLTARYETPTAITLASFEVETNDGRVMVLWKTGTEIDNAGFNIYRAPSPDGPWFKINSALIAAEGDPVSGASYTFVDTPGRGNFYYYLEDVDYFGVATRHGLALAELGPAIRVPWFRPMAPDF